jgi:tetratricopeptide (TPR) repeat protein
MKNLIYLLILLSVILTSRNTEAQTTPKDSQAVQEALTKGDTVKADLLRAKTLTMQGNSAEASKIYTRIMKSRPDNREAVQGWLMANMKRTPTGEEEAIKSLEELGRLYPKNTAIIFFKAFIEGEHGHNEEALKGFEKLTILQPDTAVNWIGKGQVLFAMNKYEEAIKAFDRATSLDPKRPDVWAMKSGALAKTARFDDAIVAANKGLELSPNNPIGIYNRACVYCLKGDTANALADLKKAISMNPSFKESARKDEDFKSLYDNEDFKKLTL